LLLFGVSIVILLELIDLGVAPGDLLGLDFKAELLFERLADGVNLQLVIVFFALGQDWLD